MSDLSKLAQLIKSRSKMVAMIAPSFPIMYDPKEIVGKLKTIGFSYVVEVSVGAKETNHQAVQILKNNPQTRFITSPCPSFVRFMRTKHPDLLHYLALEVDSPMSATAKIVRQRWPGYKPVFIGPCLVKKLEASQDYPELDILVLTYKEIDRIISQIAVNPSINSEFDMIESSTRNYPVDGGLTSSSGAKNLLQPEQIKIVSGYDNCEKAIQEFEQNKSIRLLDILFCEGGCIMGPGIDSKLSLEERKKQILDYSNK